MKRIYLLLLCLAVMPLCLFAEDEKEDDAPKKFWIKDRTVEIGFLNMSFGLASNFISIKDILQDVIVIDLDDNDIKMNFDLALSPMYFSYNRDNKWGFGFSTGVEAMGIIGLSGKMVTLSQAVNDKSDLAGAAFANVGLNGFFTIKGFKIKVKPALYYPIAYIRPDISYTNKTTDATTLNLKYSMDVFTAFPLENFGEEAFSTKSFSATMGFDLSAGVEYPLSKALGLSDKVKILDFDVGVDLINIPIVKSSMEDYMRLTGQIGKDDPMILFGEDGDDLDDSLFNFDDAVYGKDKIKIVRPFKMLSWAEWRPFFGSRLFSVIPSAGFAINPMYVKTFSMEGGLKGRLNLANLFILTTGVSYEDRLWKNSVDIAFNFRAFELDLGVDMRSQNFAESWKAPGIGAQFGFKLGW